MKRAGGGRRTDSSGSRSTSAKIERGIRRLWFGLITGLLLLLAVAAAASWRIARGMTKPLEAVTRAAQRIRNMDYEARVDVDPRGEIGELGRAVNAMAESLQRQMMRIRQKESQLESVLDNMTSGIVMIDRAGVIAAAEPDGRRAARHARPRACSAANIRKPGSSTNWCD